MVRPDQASFRPIQTLSLDQLSKIA